MSYLDVQLCQKFLENPHQNPKTGGRLTSFRGLHNHYTDLCIDNGFEEEVGVMLLTVPIKDIYDKHFVQRPLFTEKELDNLFNNPLTDSWDVGHDNDDYKRRKY